MQSGGIPGAMGTGIKKHFQVLWGSGRRAQASSTMVDTMTVSIGKAMCGGSILTVSFNHPNLGSGSLYAQGKMRS